MADSPVFEAQGAFANMNSDMSSETRLCEDYQQVRNRSLELIAPLTVDDCNVQPMPDASPPKWHLAHTTWFFETFLLKNTAADYQPFNPHFEYLFNSYYNGIGAQYPRTQRGNLSRPSLDEVLRYREVIDARMLDLIASAVDDATRHKLIVGLHHEEQHQELLLTDLKYNLGNNPLRPAYIPRPIATAEASSQVQSSAQAQSSARANSKAPSPAKWLSFPGGIQSLGCDGKPVINDRDEFTFDNESPAHDVLLRDYELASRPVSCGEYLAFMADDGYQRPELWLSDGWSTVQQNQWHAPLYWEQCNGIWHQYTLGGLHPVDERVPVCHVSFYEADAFARWSGARLPSEAEWECAVRDFHAKADVSETANLFETGCLTPVAGTDHAFIGDVWEWTASSYAPYPGFATAAGALGEYNGKFMSSQMVLRGGSCFTPRRHIRAGYRNFFYPPDRWQMSGFRLARDV